MTNGVDNSRVRVDIWAFRLQVFPIPSLCVFQILRLFRLEFLVIETHYEHKIYTRTNKATHLAFNHLHQLSDNIALVVEDFGSRPLIDPSLSQKHEIRVTCGGIAWRIKTADVSGVAVIAVIAVVEDVVAAIVVAVAEAVRRRRWG